MAVSVTRLARIAGSVIQAKRDIQAPVGREARAVARDLQKTPMTAK